MIKLLAITVAAAALAACSSMSPASSGMGNTSATKNSTDSQATQQGNRSAVSPGAGAAGAGR